MRKIQIWAGVALCSLAGAAHASIPGNLEERSNNGLRHVCIDNEPGDTDYIVCEAQAAEFQVPYTGEECAAEGLPPVCVLDFVPGVRVKATVTIILDDDAKDGGDNDVGEQTGLELVLKVKKKKYRLYDLFTGSKLGNWNSIGIEDGLLDGGIVYTNFGMTAFQFANGNLTDLGDKIVEIVDAAYETKDLSETRPLTVFMERIENVDARGEDPTASAADWKVILEFVRVRD